MAKKKETEFCGCCKYWFGHEPDDEHTTSNPLGDCKRYAPRMLSGTGTGFTDQLHPHTKMLDWCGEFEGE